MFLYLSTVSQLRLETVEWTGAFVQVHRRLRRKMHIISLQRQKLNNLNAFSYLPTFTWSSLKILLQRKNTHESQSTFCRSSCSFLSMASSCDTFSSRWPGESLQQRGAVTLRQKQSQNFSLQSETKVSKWFRFPSNKSTG